MRISVPKQLSHNNDDDNVNTNDFPLSKNVWYVGPDNWHGMDLKWWSDYRQTYTHTEFEVVEKW